MAVGKANPSALSKRPHCSLPGLQKRNSHPSALSHPPLGPKEGVISCLALWAAQAPPTGCASLISPQARSQSLAGVVWSSCFLSRKHGFRGQREPSRSGGQRAYQIGSPVALAWGRYWAPRDPFPIYLNKTSPDVCFEPSLILWERLWPGGPVPGT